MRFKILITGSAGFIGSNLVLRLLKTEPGHEIVGLDNMNDYYDVSLKEYRLQQIDSYVKSHPGCTYRFVKGNIADKT
ncbi:MAG: GDP-mannose 4,6-dehydratase, partial [Paludibacteraceae bacterium]|nr:GDP-mannose 4,6-dehydratase [Paludibacteraceae bacterium]